MICGGSLRALSWNQAGQHEVKDFLGHANITTTSRYFATSPVLLDRALDRLDPEPARSTEKDPLDLHTVCTNETPVQDAAGKTARNMLN